MLSCGLHRTGDLFYLEATTLEMQDIHITASTAGFFLNSTAHGHFDPKPLGKGGCCHRYLLFVNPWGWK